MTGDGAADQHFASLTVCVHVYDFTDTGYAADGRTRIARNLEGVGIVEAARAVINLGDRQHRIGCRDVVQPDTGAPLGRGFSGIALQTFHQINIRLDSPVAMTIGNRTANRLVSHVVQRYQLMRACTPAEGRTRIVDVVAIACHAGFAHVIHNLRNGYRRIVSGGRSRQQRRRIRRGLLILHRRWLGYVNHQRKARALLRGRFGYQLLMAVAHVRQWRYRPAPLFICYGTANQDFASLRIGINGYQLADTGAAANRRTRIVDHFKLVNRVVVFCIVTDMVFNEGDFQRKICRRLVIELEACAPAGRGFCGNTLWSLRQIKFWLDAPVTCGIRIGAAQSFAKVIIKCDQLVSTRTTQEHWARIVNGAVMRHGAGLADVIDNLSNGHGCIGCGHARRRR